jgi:hypothetical protein
LKVVVAVSAACLLQYNMHNIGVDATVFFYPAQFNQICLPFAYMIVLIPSGMELWLAIVADKPFVVGMVLIMAKCR